MCRLRLSHITAYILIALVLTAILGITAMQTAHKKDTSERQQLLEQIAALEQENLELEHLIADYGSNESMEQLARERLHWVYDQEIVYIDAGH